MTEHWQVIEAALEFWRSGEMFDEERMHIDAAIAFVREMRQGQGMPPYHIREAIGDVWGYAYASGTLEDLRTAASMLMTWLHKLTQAQMASDTHSAGAEGNDGSNA